MNQLQVEALEDEIEHWKEEAEDNVRLADGFRTQALRYQGELQALRENVMVALEELRGLPGAEGATWRLRRCLVRDLAC